MVIEQGSFDLQLFLQVGFKLCVDIFYYRLVAEERKCGTAKTRAFATGTTQVTDWHSRSFMGALYIMGQAVLLWPSPPNLQFLPSKRVFPLGAQGEYYGHNNKIKWQRPWTLGAWQSHTTATLKKNVFCSLSNWSQSCCSANVTEKHPVEENLKLKPPPTLACPKDCLWS